MLRWLLATALLVGVESGTERTSFIDLATGPLADTQCNLETVEAANNQQLSMLLHELSSTPFFRLINVNMDGKCQYWGGPDADEPACESKAEDTPVPLCTLGTDASADPFGADAMGGGSSSPFSSDAQSSMSAPLDITITPEEHAFVGAVEQDCGDETLPSFWLDMCSAIPTNASDYVNLQLNEESYTGYNGTHVWEAIYNENCLQRTGGSEANICLEERVLYRLLSGMHAATNTHVARFYHPPSKRKNRTDWEPNLDYFKRQFDGHPERLKNLHFAFVVLLRAVRRASPFLSTYDYSPPSGSKGLGAGLEQVDGMDASALVRRFLDTAILKSCNAVFEAFDEGLLFREEQASWWSLKKQFKGVFHNVSRVIDCVSCQKCRLHAKVTMLGYGTALKMLLLPPELLPTSFSRDEVVALFNTLHKFSTAILHVKELTALAYERYYSNDAPDPAAAGGSGAAAGVAAGTVAPPSGRAVAAAAKAASVPAASLAAAASPAAASSHPATGRSATADVAGATSAATAATAAAAERSALERTYGADGYVALLDTALGALSRVAAAGELTAAEEAAAVTLALRSDSRLLLAARHFGSMASFGAHVRSALLAAFLQPTSAPSSTADAAAAGAAAAGATAASATVPPAGPSYGVGLSQTPDAVVVGGGVAGMTAALRLLDRGAHVVLLDKERIVGGNSAKASSGINGCCPPHSRSERNADDSIGAFAADTARSAKREASGLIGLLAERSSSAIEWLLERTSIDLSKLAQLGGHSHARTHRPANGMIGAELTFALHKELKAYAKRGQLAIRTGCRMTGFVLEGGGGMTAASRVAGVRYIDSASGEEVELRTPQTVLATGGFANDRTNTSLLAKHRPDLLAYPTTNGEWATGDGMKLAMEIGAGTVDMDRVQVHPTGFVDAAKPNASTKVLCGEMMRGVGGILLTPKGERFVNELAPRDKVVDGQLSTGHAEFVLLLNADMAAEAGRHVELYTRKGLLVPLEGVDALASWMLSDRGVSGAADAHADTADAREGLKARLRATLASYAEAAVGGSDEFGKTSFRHAPLLADGQLYAGRIVPVLHYTMGGIEMDREGRVLRADGSLIEGLSAAGEVTGGVHGNNRLGGNSLLECTVFGSIVGLRLPIASQQAAPTLAPPSLPPMPPPVAAPVGGGEADATAGQLRIVSAEELAAHKSASSCWVALHGKVYDFTSFLEEHPAGPESILKLGGTDGTDMYETVHNAAMLDDFETEIVGLYQP